MELAPALARYAHALGRRQAAWRFASPELRRAVALAQISATWDTFCRDAGLGAVGREHQEPLVQATTTCTEDPRRDRLLLWLWDHGNPAIAEAVSSIARIVGSGRRFSADEHEPLEAARDALAPATRPGPIGGLLAQEDSESGDVLAPLNTMSAAVDRLRSDPAFLESSGSEVRHQLPCGAISHYVPAEPDATWALNLALLIRGPWSQGTPPVAELVSRALLRSEAEPEDVAVALVDGATAALISAYAALDSLSTELDRGSAALSNMSRNSRSRDAWLLLAALRSITRIQLARGLALLRAGANIQVHTLADTRL